MRGAIAGALKKNLGLKVESEKVDPKRGRVYRIWSRQQRGHWLLRSGLLLPPPHMRHARVVKYIADRIE